MLSNRRHSFMTVLLIVISMFLLCTTALAQTNKTRIGLSVSPMQASPLLLQHLRLAEGEGLMVNNIAVGSELEAEGLSQGDIVLAADGHPLNNPSDLQNYIASLPTGAKVTLDVIQKGEHRQIIVTLDNLPDEIVWKFVQPIAGPGRSKMGIQNAPAPLQGQNAPRSQNQRQFQFGTNGGSSVSTFSSIIATGNGVQMSTVTIRGDKSDPSSEVEIVIGDNTYKTTIGEKDQLPEEARAAIDNALNQSDHFSFGFGSSGGDIFDQIMRRQMEQMRQMDELFQQHFQMPGTVPQDPSPQPNEQLLVPVPQGKGHIRT